MIFRQLFEATSSTYTYLLACERTGQAVLIDPVYDTAERDIALVKSLGLSLAYTLDTHIHADHLTGARKAKTLVKSKIAAPKMDGLSCVDLGVEEGCAFQVGDLLFHPLFTPGHTDAHHAYVLEQEGTTRLFSGDCLLIDGCGRTDFQNGDARRLDPCHDYQGRFVSTIAQEKTRNPRVGLKKSEPEFLEIMNKLHLPYPKRIELAVPGNRLCGECPPNIPEEMRRLCEAHDQG